MKEFIFFPFISKAHTHTNVICTHNISALNCFVVNRTYVVEIQNRVLVPLGPSSISAVAELVFFIDFYRLHYMK